MYHRAAGDHAERSGSRDKIEIAAHHGGRIVVSRLGAHQKVWVGYCGTLNLVFETANLFQAKAKEAQKLAHN